MLQLIYLPAFLLLSYFWITPESIRWNLTKGRIREAQDILRKAASVNGKTISEHALEKLSVQDTAETEKRDPLLKVFKSVPLLLRFINCCFCWITCTFLFYGLTLNSVSLAGNSYLDFILTSLVEVPAYFACYFVVDRIGRRASQAGSFLLTGLACIAFIFVPQSRFSLAQGVPGIKRFLQIPNGVNLVYTWQESLEPLQPLLSCTLCQARYFQPH